MQAETRGWQYVWHRDKDELIPKDLFIYTTGACLTYDHWYFYRLLLALEGIGQSVFRSRSAH